MATGKYRGEGGGGTITGAFVTSGDISPAQITSDQDDYDPTGLGTAAVLRVSSDALRKIRSLAGGSDGRELTIHNVGSNYVRLPHEDGTTAGNRFALPHSVAYDIAPGGSASLWYDSTSSRWRLKDPRTPSTWDELYRAIARDKLNLSPLQMGFNIDDCAQVSGQPWARNVDNGNVKFTTVHGPTKDYDSSSTAPGYGNEFAFDSASARFIQAVRASDKLYIYARMSVALATTPANLVTGIGILQTRDVATDGCVFVGLVGTNRHASGSDTKWVGMCRGSAGSNFITHTTNADATYRDVEFWHDGTNLNLRIDGVTVTPVASTNWPSVDDGTMGTWATMVTAGRAVLRVKRRLVCWNMGV